MASFFVHYLKHTLNSEPESVKFSCSCSGLVQKLPLRSETGFAQGDGTTVVEFRGHTPQFYRQMITCEKVTDFLLYSLTHPYDENHTAWSNDPVRLISMLDDFELPKTSREPSSRTTTAIDFEYLLWGIFKRLRRTYQLKGAYPYPGFPKTRTDALKLPSKPSQSNRECFLDIYVRLHFDQSMQLRYMLATLSLQWRTKVMSIMGGE